MLSEFKKNSEMIVFPAISPQEFDAELALNDIKRIQRHQKMLIPPGNAKTHNVSPGALSPQPGAMSPTTFTVAGDTRKN